MIYYHGGIIFQMSFVVLCNFRELSSHLYSTHRLETTLGTRSRGNLTFDISEASFCCSSKSCLKFQHMTKPQDEFL